MKYCTAIFLFCFLHTAFAETVVHSDVRSFLNGFLPQSEVAQLLNDRPIIRSVYDSEDMSPCYTPPFSVPEQFVWSWNQGKPACLIETLYLYRKSGVAVKDVEKISRILRSLSQLQGLEYYSSSRKKMRTLYEKSYVISGVNDTEPVADPLDITDKDFSVYVLQKDLSFGENIYRYRFVIDDDSAGFTSTNTGTLKYSIFKAVSPEQLQASLSVTDLGSHLLIHGMTRAQFISFSMLKNKIQNSFRTRGEAILRWFITHYEKE